MSGFSAIDLSKLPAPEVVETVTFEDLLEEMTQAVAAAMPEMASHISFESDPVRQTLRICAYFRMLDRLEFNDRAKSLLLAKATGGDLDHLAAFWGVKREYPIFCV